MSDEQPHCVTCTCHLELSNPDANTVGAHHKKPRDTELDAAYQVQPATGTKRRMVLDAIAAAGVGGLTDVEIADVTGMHFQTSQPRRHELMRGGWVEDSGARRETGKGGTAIVWVLTIRGSREYFGISSTPRRRRVTRTPRESTTKEPSPRRRVQSPHRVTSRRTQSR